MTMPSVATDQASGPPRLHGLDGLRGLLALIVLIHHSLVRLYPMESGEGTRLPIDVLLPADYAVRVFFVLSGMVVALKFFRTDDWRWPAAMALRRPVRLWIPVAASLVIGAALLVVLPFQADRWAAVTRGQPFEIAAGVPARLLMLDLSGYTLGSGHSAVVGSWWSMPVELYCSMALLLLLIGWGLAGAHVRWVMGAGYAALLGLFVASGPDAPGITPESFNEFVGLLLLLSVSFVLGAGLAWVWVHHSLWMRDSSRGRLLGLGALVAGVVVALAPSLVVRGLGGHRTAAQVLIQFGAAMIVLSVLATPWLERLLRHRTILWLGALSFPVYLVHESVQLSIMARVVLLLDGWGVPYHAAAMVGFLVQLGVVLLIADLLARSVEKVALRAGKNRSNLAVGLPSAT